MAVLGPVSVANALSRPGFAVRDLDAVALDEGGARSHSERGTTLGVNGHREAPRRGGRRHVEGARARRPTVAPSASSVGSPLT